jgi:cephalosporin hydroxylase
LAGASVQSDISDHLPSIYYFTLVTKPRLLVELGTRGGESTRALLAAANDAGGVLLSIDIENCQRVDTPFRDRWHFVQADDVLFARDGFKEWAKERGVNPTVDVLFIDTSHEFHHTLAEVRAWSTHLSPEATMIFHDTNMGPGVYARLDGSVGRAWDNDRGVIRAIEELIGRKYDERAFFSDRTDKYSVLHFPNCNGLTVIRLLPQN